MGAKKKCTLIDSNMRAVYGYIIVMSKKFEEYIDNVVRMDSEEHHSVTHYDPIVWNVSTIQRLWMFFFDYAIINRKMLICSLRSSLFSVFVFWVDENCFVLFEIFLECNLKFATKLSLIHPFSLYTYFQQANTPPPPPNEIN